MSSPTRSTSTSETVVVALGSNLGDRRFHLARAVDALRSVIDLVRLSSVYETDPVDAPAGSPDFLNMVVVGITRLEPDALLKALHAIESRLGRAPRQRRNEPRVIDLDLILYGAHRIRTSRLELPHPRASNRDFVMRPLAEVSAPAVRFLSR